MKGSEIERYMLMAVEEAEKGMRKMDGGPFGAVIVRDGEVLAAAHNEVVGSNDPTAHAEIVAIRKACSRLEASISKARFSSLRESPVRCVFPPYTGHI